MEESSAVGKTREKDGDPVGPSEWFKVGNGDILRRGHLGVCKAIEVFFVSNGTSASSN